MFADILDTREPRGYPDLQARILAEMGEGDPPPELAGPRSDVSGIRAALGI